MIASKRWRYFVQERWSSSRVWRDLPGFFVKHADARRHAKALTDQPDNRGHDRYYRVRRVGRSNAPAG